VTAIANAGCTFVMEEEDPDKALASDNGPSGGRHVATGERTATASAKPPTQGEQAQGEPAQGEHVQRETSSTWSDLPARYSKVFRTAAGILKHHVAPHDDDDVFYLFLQKQYTMAHRLGDNGTTDARNER
jgi:hypothetical protein